MRKRKSPRKAVQPLETRTQILKAAVNLAFRIGVENLTLQKVAAEAKLSYFGVHYYFGGKDQGFTEEAARHVGNEAQKYISAYIDREAGDPKTNLLKSYIRGTLKWAHKEKEDASFWIYYYYLCSKPGSIQDLNQSVVEGAQIRIQRLLDECIGKRQIPRVRDTEALAALIHFQLVGAGVMLISLNKNWQATADLTLQAVDALIKAHSTRAQPE